MTEIVALEQAVTDASNHNNDRESQKQSFMKRRD